MDIAGTQEHTDRHQAPIPISVSVSRAERIFTVEWEGRHPSLFGLDDLRSMCDCAKCRVDREEQEIRQLESRASRMLPILGAVNRSAITSVDHVGRYALGVFWEDGHQSIYTYEFLYASCLCGECRAINKTE